MNKTHDFENYRYHIDSISEERIVGWAFKTDEIDHHPVIEVRSGDQVLWTVDANVYRDDLEQAGFGNGEYGFVLLPERASIQTAISSVNIYIDGYLVQAEVPFEIAPVDITSYQIHLDYVSADGVRGWVYKNDQDSHHSAIEVRSGEVVIASGLAENFRQDLLDANIGDGHYGFALTPRLENFPMTECECQLFVDGEKVSHIEDFVLSAEQDAIEEAVYKATFAEETSDFTQSVEAKLAELKATLMVENQDSSSDDFAVNGQLAVTLNHLAELSVRVRTIEQILVKYASK